MIINRMPFRRACQSKGYDICFDPALSTRYRGLSEICDSYSTENVESLADRGTQSPTYDSPDTVGIDIASDFHTDRFDQFEIIKSAKLAALDKASKEKYLENLRKSFDSDASEPKADTDTAK